MARKGVVDTRVETLQKLHGKSVGVDDVPVTAGLEPPALELLGVLGHEPRVLGEEELTRAGVEAGGEELEPVGVRLW